MSAAAFIAAVLASVAIVWWLLHSAGWRMTLVRQRLLSAHVLSVIVWRRP